MTIGSLHIVAPREHGAWTILLLPYLCGAIIGGDHGFRELMGLAAVLLLFVSRPPLMQLIKRKRIDGSYGQAAGSLAAGFLLPAAISSAIFLWMIAGYGLWCLLAPGAIGLSLFVLHQQLIKRSHERTASAELAGIMMLSLTAPVAWCIASGTISLDAWVLYLLIVLYFGASVFYVKMRIRAPKDKSAATQGGLKRIRRVMAYLALMLVSVVIFSATGLAPTLVPLAYLPMTAYLSWNMFSSHAVKRIMVEGLLQTALAVIFAGLIIFIYLA